MAKRKTALQKIINGYGVGKKKDYSKVKVPVIPKPKKNMA